MSMATVAAGVAVLSWATIGFWVFQQIMRAIRRAISGIGRG